MHNKHSIDSDIKYNQQLYTFEKGEIVLIFSYIQTPINVY